MDFYNQPKMPNREDHEMFGGLWLRDDGLWRFDHGFWTYPTAVPFAVGVATATHFVMGAMATGCKLERAVKMAIERCQYVGGPVQVETLRPVGFTE